MTKTFTQFIHESSKLRDKISLSLSTKRFIDLWVSGESKALRILNQEIKSELKTSLSQDNYRLMRTWKFTSQEELEEFFGVPVSRGKKVEVNLPSPTSWTKAPQVAQSFSNPRIDAFSKKYFSDEDLEEMEYEEGELLAISVTCFSSIPKKNLIADLDNIKGIKDHLDEKEVIVDSGTLSITVMKLQDWFFVKNKEDAIDIVDLNPNSEDDLEKERQRESSLLDVKVAFIEKELENKPPEEILNSLQTDLELVALAMTSGVKNPPLISLIKEKAKDSNIKKTLKYFSLFSMISMIERW
jgi:Holliday junction resolvase RusA-like endonuclease